MLEKPDLLPFAALFEALNNTPGTVINPYTALPVLNPALDAITDLHRIANALERIAAAFEKLPINAANVPVEINRNNPKGGETITEAPFKQPTKFKQAQPPRVPEIVQKQVMQAPVPAAVVASVRPPEVIPARKKVLPTHPIPVGSSITEQKEVLVSYFKQLGIDYETKKKTNSPEQETKLNDIAIYLGKNFRECEELYKFLKRDILAKPGKFFYHLKEINPDKKLRISRFCNLLIQAGLLEKYAFEDGPENIIEIEVTGKDCGFLKGNWLERYVEYEVKRIVKKYTTYPGRAYEALSNLRVNINGKGAEFDLVFAVGQKVFCIEAKTRPGQQDLKTSLNKIKPLKLDNRSILIVTAEKSIQECLKLTEVLGGTQVTDLSSLEQKVTAMIEVAHKG
ncbi:MAG: hypothetical protein JWP00_760 [Chloroflexi bacterium]|nr:hypothetical protein [Chloroflexota bacterium]